MTATTTPTSPNAPRRTAPAPILTRRALLAGSAAVTAATALTACGKKGGDDANTITVLTHDDFNLPEDLLAAFQKDSGLTVSISKSGSGGELANQLVLTKDAPLGDAFFGVDNSFISRLAASGVVDPASTITLPAGAEDYLVDGAAAIAPIDFGEVALNYDVAYLTDHGLTPPASFEDLTKPENKGLAVLINPSTSTTGLCFLLATIAHFGEDGFADYWKRLVANGAKIVEGWTAAYSVDFSAGEGRGAYPIVLSYSSSPAATVSADGTTSTTASVPATAFRQIEYAGVLAGAKNPSGAKAFIEWLLNKDVQTAIPDSMYMYPVSAEATLSPAMTTFGALSASPLALDPAAIADKRETWLAAWTEAVGQ
ncbi:thiamine ABC transporter substrate-binding protein [Actinomyces gaoshouyii]|uniref:thiamine ABC transporter substrate-binding protein n=1 Tax=Actinomyces gaoshouyii TaxID=1960083 RepID=UPI0009C097B3|nr:thiamine ABC transporter substrate-binding protein [Actinomyces gaoshouyii]ARD41029.1 thiamine ABC transporter substrate-binding protein [Actinomyces gaoshouyii]